MSADQNDNSTRPIDRNANATAQGEPVAPTTSLAPPLPPETAFASPYRPGGAEPLRRPSIRWGGVVWGAILVLFALAILWIVSARSRLVAAQVWVSTLTPASAWTLALVAAGAIILILALLAVVRSAQRAERF